MENIMEKPLQELENISSSMYSIDLKEKIDKLRGDLKGGIGKIRTRLESGGIDLGYQKETFIEIGKNFLPGMASYRHYKKHGDLKAALISWGKKDIYPIVATIAVSYLAAPYEIGYLIYGWGLAQFLWTGLYTIDQRGKERPEETPGRQ